MDVNAFFPRQSTDPDSPVDLTNEFNLEPVPRTVDDREPARGIINQLLLNPTDEEQLIGFYPLDTEGLTIQMISIANGIARLTLTGRPHSEWVSDVSRLVLDAAIRKTLLQFDTVNSVVTSATL
jgi:hypothetical protein